MHGYTHTHTHTHTHFYVCVYFNKIGILQDIMFYCLLFLIKFFWGMVLQAAWFSNEGSCCFSIAGVWVGSAWCSPCPWGAQSRDRPTDTHLEMCGPLGSEGPAEAPPGLGGASLAWPLAPGLAAPAAPITAWVPAQLGAEPITALPSGFRCLSWRVLACPEPPLSGLGGVRVGPAASEDCGKSRASEASGQGDFASAEPSA